MASTQRLVRAHFSSVTWQAPIQNPPYLLGRDTKQLPGPLPPVSPYNAPTTQSLAPGSLSLNLRGVSVDQVPGFHAAVSDLVPKCVKVPITTKSLSENFKFAPKKVGIEVSIKCRQVRGILFYGPHSSVLPVNGVYIFLWKSYPMKSTYIQQEVSIVHHPLEYKKTPSCLNPRGRGRRRPFHPPS